MMLDVTCCCGAGGGGAGGGCVATAAGLVVQAASSNTADSAANLNVLENFIMTIDLEKVNVARTVPEPMTIRGQNVQGGKKYQNPVISISNSTSKRSAAVPSVIWICP